MQYADQSAGFWTFNYIFMPFPLVMTPKISTIASIASVLAAPFARRSFLFGIRLRRALALTLALACATSLGGCGLYQTKTAFVPYKAVAVTG